MNFVGGIFLYINGNIFKAFLNILTYIYNHDQLHCTYSIIMRVNIALQKLGGYIRSRSIHLRSKTMWVIGQITVTEEDESGRINGV